WSWAEFRKCHCARAPTGKDCAMLRMSILVVIVVACITAVSRAQDSVLSDTRISVHTLIREDVFAGILEDDMQRLEKGEKNIEILLEQRPKEKASLLAWKAGVTMFRGVLALEDKRTDDFEKKYTQGLELLKQAKALAPDDVGVNAVT